MGTCKSYTVTRDIYCSLQMKARFYRCIVIYILHYMHIIIYIHMYVDDCMYYDIFIMIIMSSGCSHNLSRML